MSVADLQQVVDKDAEIDRLRQALTDVVDTMGYLKRKADAEGATLNGHAHSIANNLGVVREIARDALAGK